MAIAGVGNGTQSQSHQEGRKDTQLGGGAQHQRYGVGQQRAKIRHSANTHKDNGWVYGVLDALIEHPHKAHRSAVGGGIIDGLVEQPGDRQVSQQHTKGDGNQQQRLEALANAHI